MIEHDSPYLIHCEAGIDRTGLLSTIFEAFMGAEFNNIVKDYMLSFVDDNEYSINDYKNGTIFMMNLFSKIKGELINQNENLQSLATKYIIENIGLNNEEIKLLTDKLMNNKL